MKKYKKVVAGLSAACALTFCAGVVALNMVPSEAAQDEWGYYGKKLTNPVAISFYEALCEMDFSSGDASAPITTAAVQASAMKYTNGDKDLLNQFGAAVGSFRYDHTEIFNVDFDLLTTNVYRTQDGGYAVELGAGRADTYFTDGFEPNSYATMKADYDTKLNALAQSVDSGVVASETHSTTYQRALYANREICNLVEYSFCVDEEGNDLPESAYIRSSYGALVNKKCVCEGYARLFKAVMNKLGEECELVTGYLLNSDSDGGVEPHMWNAVKDGDKWYAVDVTRNDSTRHEGSAGQWSNGDYFMVTANIIEIDHIEEPVISTADYEMPYPVIYRQSYDSENGNLRVTYTSVIPDDSSDEMRVLDVSYVEKDAAGTETLYNATELLEEKGYYLAMRYYNAADQTWQSWNSAESAMEMFTGMPWYFEKPGHFYHIYDNQSSRQIQFAVFGTTPDAEYNPLVKRNISYSKDAIRQHLVENSQVIENPDYNPTYVIPAFIESTRPSQLLTTKQDISKTLPVKIVYDQTLVKKDPDKDYGYKLFPYAIDNRDYSQEEVLSYTKVTDFHWDGYRTITFNITPSNMFAHNDLCYEFSLTNLVNQPEGDMQTGVAPNGFDIVFHFTDSVACSKCLPGGRMKVNGYGQPVLADNSDLSVNGWTYKDEKGNEKKISEGQRSQLALVVTRPANDVQESADKALDKAIAADDNIQEGAKMVSATYDINLNFCRKLVTIPNGSYVKINFGFPAGITADMEGVTFKVYHFKKTGDDLGTIDYEHPEILDCVVTKLGIVVTMDSFSPFTIVAFKSSKIQDTTRGIETAADGIGGKISTSSNKPVNFLKEGETITYTLTPEQGYEVEYVGLNGNPLTVTDGKVTLNYSDLEENNVLQAGFVSTAVKQQEVTENKQNVKQEFVTHTIKQDLSIEQNLPQKFFVTFDSNGGSAVAPQTVTSGGLVTLPVTPEKAATSSTSFTFAGWKLNGKTYDFATPVTKDITLVADWTEKAIETGSGDITPPATPSASNDGWVIAVCVIAVVLAVAAVAVACVFVLRAKHKKQ